jgi:quercetin dioxygenase-like cupin family protein
VTEHEWIEDPVLRQRYRFTRTAEPDGEVLHVETWVEPGGGVTPHRHPAMEERFEVLEGTPSFLAGRRWDTSNPGETVVVPAGTRHAYRNRGDEPAHFVCHVRPPSSLEQFLTEVAALSRAGMITRHGIPKTPRGLLLGAVLIEHYREMAELLPPTVPPPALQRVLLPPLARLAVRRGIRPGHLAEAVR